MLQNYIKGALKTK